MWKCPKCETLNTADICMICQETKPIRQLKTEDSSEQITAENNDSISALKPISISALKSESYWTCSKCNSHNEQRYLFCRDCDTYRPTRKEHKMHYNVRKQTYWVCKKCTSHNELGKIHCKDCGAYK